MGRGHRQPVEPQLPSVPLGGPRVTTNPITDCLSALSIAQPWKDSHYSLRHQRITTRGQRRSVTLLAPTGGVTAPQTPWTPLPHGAQGDTQGHILITLAPLKSQVLVVGFLSPFSRWVSQGLKPRCAFPQNHPETTAECLQRIWAYFSGVFQVGLGQTKETAGSAGLIQIPLEGDLGLLLNLVVLDMLSPQFSDLPPSVTCPLPGPGPDHLRVTAEAQGNPQGGHEGVGCGSAGQGRLGKKSQTCGHGSLSSIPVRPRWEKKQQKPSRLLTCVPPEPLQHIFPF